MVPEALPSDWLLSRCGRGLRPPPVPTAAAGAQQTLSRRLVGGRSGRRLATSRPVAVPTQATICAIVAASSLHAGTPTTAPHQT